MDIVRKFIPYMAGTLAPVVGLRTKRPPRKSLNVGDRRKTKRKQSKTNVHQRAPATVPRFF